MKSKALNLLTALLIALAAFIAGRASSGLERHNEIRDAYAYIEDCTLADAHANKCAIPCGSEADCIEKNGSNDNY